MIASTFGKKKMDTTVYNIVITQFVEPLFATAGTPSGPVVPAKTPVATLPLGDTVSGGGAEAIIP